MVERGDLPLSTNELITRVRGLNQSPGNGQGERPGSLYLGLGPDVRIPLKAGEALIVAANNDLQFRAAVEKRGETIKEIFVSGRDDVLTIIPQNVLRIIEERVGLQKTIEVLKGAIGQATRDSNGDAGMVKELLECLKLEMVRRTKREQLLLRISSGSGPLDQRGEATSVKRRPNGLPRGHGRYSERTTTRRQRRRNGQGKAGAGKRKRS